MHRALLIAVTILAGCGARQSMPPVGPDGSRPDDSNAALGIIDQWGLWGAWAGGAILFIAAIGMVLLPAHLKARAFQASVLGATLMAAGYALVWLAANEWVFILAILAAGLLAAWSGRHWIEQRIGIDLDRDGVIGETST